jgi:putative flippase GtrA
MRNVQFILSYRRGCTLDTRMTETPTREPQKNRQALRTRFLWFLAGAGVNYLLISTPFKWLKAHTALPEFAIPACSVAVGATFFFVWNYFINFRTARRKRDALPRYIVAVCCMWLVQSGILAALKHFHFQAALHLGRFPLDLDIIATQFLPSGLKFYLYHKWVFPVPKESPIQPPQAPAE